MKQVALLLFVLLICTNCEKEENLTPTTNTLDRRDYLMGDFQVPISVNYPIFPPTNSNHTPLQNMNLTIYKSTAYDNEIIIDGIHGSYCVYAIMDGNNFTIDSKETSLRPEDLGFSITPYCAECKVRITGSGSITEVSRGNETPKLTIQYNLSYDYTPLVKYSGNVTYNLPRPNVVANDC